LTVFVVEAFTFLLDRERVQIKEGRADGSHSLIELLARLGLFLQVQGLATELLAIRVRISAPHVGFFGDDRAIFGFSVALDVHTVGVIRVFVVLLVIATDLWALRFSFTQVIGGGLDARFELKAGSELGAIESTAENEVGRGDDLFGHLDHHRYLRAALGLAILVFKAGGIDSGGDAGLEECAKRAVERGAFFKLD